LRGMQNLLTILQFEATSAHFQPWELIVPVLEEYSAILQEAGVRVEASNPDQAIAAIGDPARTVQAVHSVLAAATSLSSEGDVIELDLIKRIGFLDIRIQNKNPHTKKLSSIDRLNLSMAEESILSQRGLYEWAENPFRISFKLPLVQEDETDGETALDCAPKQEIRSSIC